MSVQEARRLAHLTEFTRAVFAATTLPEVATAALGGLVESGFANRAYLTFKQADGTPFDRLHSCNSAETTSYEVRGLAGMTVQRMLAWQDELLIPDASQDESLGDECQVYGVEIGSVLCLPLGDTASGQGGLYVDRAPGEAPFGQGSLAMARQYAVIIGQACASLTKIEAVSRRQEHLETLLGIFRTVYGVMELSTLLDHVTQMSLAITKAERAFVLLVEGSELTYGAGRDRETLLPPVNFRRISHSVCQQVLESGQEVCVFNAAEDATFSARQSVVNLQLQGVVAVPLMGRDGVVGILYIDSSNRVLDGLRQEMKLLRAVGSVAGLVIENARMYQRVTVDPRTGLYARGLLGVRLEEELVRSKRYDRPCALLMLGVDDLAALGDDVDTAMRMVSQILRLQLRGGIDFPARFDDARLAMILPETGPDGAWTLAERIREKVASASFAGHDGAARALTLSVGVAIWQAPDQTADELTDDAVDALETARQAGNLTVI
ncbi:MAG: diguanylate cyclase with sensor [Cyanobacteria bacterium RYN_339]|nr:diguanylate cyclase with sensor [Cyanobacteria bacterium RYN_339]